MAISDITFIKGQGGLGTPLPGEDFISGLLFYTANANLPSGFSTTNRIKSFGSIQDAEQAGITLDYSDATAATATLTITAIGADGNTLNISINTPSVSGVTLINLGTYKKVASDSTVTLVAASITDIINSGSSIHGYTATAAAGVITIKAPKSSGIYLNTGTPIIVSITGTIAATLVQFTGGTFSLKAAWYYHIKEYFRMQPSGVVFVGFFPIPSTYDFTEIQTMQVFADGKIRQMGIYKDGTTPSTSDMGLIQGVLITLEDLKMPISSVLYTANMASITDLTTLTDLNLLNCPGVSFVIAQDAAGLGNFLYITSGKSITTLGATLGTIALSSVSESIGNPSRFNISDGFECDTVNFANGQAVKTSTQSLLNRLDNYRYIFLLKRVGVKSGTFFNNSYTAVTSTSDYAFIYRNRTIDKAKRGLYSTIVLDIQSQIVINQDGTIKASSIEFFKREAERPLSQMVRDGELSAFDVLIKPNQPVLSTGKLIITINLVPIGIANDITVNIGFTNKI